MSSHQTILISVAIRTYDAVLELEPRQAVVPSSLAPRATPRVAASQGQCAVSSSLNDGRKGDDE